MQRVNIKKKSPKINSHNLASFWMYYKNKQNQKSNINSLYSSIVYTMWNFGNDQIQMQKNKIKFHSTVVDVINYFQSFQLSAWIEYFNLFFECRGYGNNVLFIHIEVATATTKNPFFNRKTIINENKVFMFQPFEFYSIFSFVIFLPILKLVTQNENRIQQRKIVKSNENNNRGKEEKKIEENASNELFSNFNLFAWRKRIEFIGWRNATQMHCQKEYCNDFERKMLSILLLKHILYVTILPKHSHI